MNADRSALMTAVARLLILAGAGTIGLVFVFPMFQSGNEPRPSLQANDDLFGVVIDGIAQDASPTLWATVTATDPASTEGSELEVVLQFDGTDRPSTLDGAIFLQGELAESLVACDVGQTADIEFNAFSEVEKQLAFELLNSSSEDRATDELVLAERAASMSFKRVSFKKEYEASQNENSVRSLWIKCRLDSGPLWSNPVGSIWDVDMSPVGLSVANSREEDGAFSGSVKIYAALDVSRGEQLFYQEGYPAPAARDQEKDNYKQSSNGNTYSNERVKAVANAITARYSDSVDESQRNSYVFLAGVLAGLFVSFIGTGLIGVLDTWSKFDPGYREPKPVVQPAPRSNRLTRLLRRK